MVWESGEEALDRRYFRVVELLAPKTLLPGRGKVKRQTRSGTCGGESKKERKRGTEAARDVTCGSTLKMNPMHAALSVDGRATPYSCQ